MQVQKKKSRQEQIDELCAKLESRRVFNDTDWKHYNSDLYYKWLNYTGFILRKTRELYCNYSPYQSICHDVSLATCRLMMRADALKTILESEGYNLCVAVYAIYRWLSHYSISCVTNAINTLYVVGGAETDAETFCNSIVQMLHCVVVGDINALDIKDIAKARDQIKMLYFPPVADKPFQNPIVNTFLAGRRISTVLDGDIVTVGQIKCLVRLKSLPPLNALPTSHQQHIILQFDQVGTGVGFRPYELRRYIDTILHSIENSDFICKNAFGAICSSGINDVSCITCARNFNHVLAASTTDTDEDN